MRATPFAFSVHHFIASVGADAGFAAIIGLAILVLLFFAQARETASLRQRLTDSDQQLHRLELYVDQLARSTARPPQPAAGTTGVGQPAAGVPAALPPAAALGGPAPDRVAPAYAGAGSPMASRAGGPAPAPVGVTAAIPAAPAGVGAPALSAATRLIPASDSGPISVRSLKPAASVQRGPIGAGGAAVMAPPSPPPSTAAAVGNGGGAGRVAPLTGATGAGDHASPRRPLRRANGPTASAGRRRAAGVSRGGRINRGALALAIALVAVIVVVGLLVLTGSNGGGKTASASTPSSTTSAPSKSRRQRRSTNTVVPSSVTVAVLNGTPTSNLAHHVMSNLSAVGYKQGAIATASDQTLTATIVGYRPSFRRQAVAVARSLKLGPASVQAVSPANQTVACSATATACAAQVVVTVGSDLAPNT